MQAERENGAGVPERWSPRIALLAGALPALGTSLGFALARWSGDLGPMNPLVDGDVSISRAMRHEPALQVFRAFVLPSATLMALTWLAVAARLRGAGCCPRALRSIAILGVLGAVFLVLYGSYLGTDGAVYRALRRYGVYVFFAGTGVALTITALRWPAGVAPRARAALRAITAALWAAGPLQLLYDFILGKSDRAANVLEWWIAGALMAGFVLLARLLRHDGQRAR